MANITYGSFQAVPNAAPRALSTPKRAVAAVLVIASSCLVLIAVCSYWVSARDSRAHALLSSPVFPLPILRLAIRDEGSNAIAYSPWAANGEMRKERETEVGLPGWEPGPDYYSTVKWDNQPTLPDNSRRYFDPYTGHEGCTNCSTARHGAVVFSVTPSCDSACTTTNIKRILRPVISDPFTSPAWANSRYEEWKWADHQLGYLLSFYEHLTLIIPPCFVPRFAFSWSALGLMNEAIYQRGMNVLIVGGLSGIDFLSRFLAGNDGYGYLDAASGDMQGASATSALDRVWAEGPFYMQNDAASTVLLYGPRVLRSVGVQVVGVPASQLPPETKHYYMSDDEVSVVFEVPSGQGRIIFIGFDYAQIEPRWADLLLLAERELQLPEHEALLPPQVLPRRSSAAAEAGTPRRHREREKAQAAPRGGGRLRRRPQVQERPEPFHAAEPTASAAPPAAEEEEEELENDVRKLVNYYCAQWMALPYNDARALSKCQGQDCNDRMMRDDGVDGTDPCEWMNQFGFCYTLEAQQYCEEHPEDATQCFDAEDNVPQYAYDPQCGGA